MSREREQADTETTYVEHYICGDPFIFSVVYGIGRMVRGKLDDLGYTIIAKDGQKRFLYSGPVTEEDYGILVAARLKGEMTAAALSTFICVRRPTNEQSDRVVPEAQAVKP